MPSVFSPPLSRPTAFLSVALILAAALPALATTPLALAAEAAAAGTADSSSKRTVIFAGDQPVIVTRARTLFPIQLDTTASLRLDARIVNRTAPGTTLEKLQAQAAEIAALKPDAVVIFAGPADEAAGTSEDKQMYTLQSTARALESAGAAVFVVPASTAVSASGTASLRIAASGAGSRVFYVDLGGELSGNPFNDALLEIRRGLDAAPAPSLAPVAPSMVLELPDAPAADPTPAAPSRTASAAGEKEAVLPPALAGTSEGGRSAAEPQEEKAGAASGRTRAVGPEATPTIINMRAPAPLKQFSPAKPAPNKPNEKKKPSFSR